MPSLTPSIFFTLIILALWQLQWLAGFLNQKAYPSKIPTLLRTSLPPEKFESGRAYLQQNIQFSFLQHTAQLIAFLAIWWLGGFNLLHEFCLNLHSNFLLQTASFFSILTLALTLFDAPFSYYHTFSIEQKFGFNRSSKTLFFQDLAKNLLLSLALLIPLLLIILHLFAKFPHAWWLAWLSVTAFQLSLAFLAPTCLLPLFYQFTPMPNNPLREKISQLSNRAAFPLQGIFIIDGSKRSSKANAFFTGFGKNKRIALFDTLLQSHSDEEILAILAHEIGHAQKGHIRKHLTTQILSNLILFAALSFAIQPSSPLSQLFHRIFLITHPTLISGAFVFFLILSPLQTLIAIPRNATSRRHEFEADAYATQLTNPNDLATALRKLNTEQLAHPTPHPLRIWLDYSHPPLLQRLQAIEKNS